MMMPKLLALFALFLGLGLVNAFAPPVVSLRTASKSVSSSTPIMKMRKKRDNPQAVDVMSSAVELEVAAPDAAYSTVNVAEAADAVGEIVDEMAAPKTPPKVSLPEMDINKFVDDSLVPVMKFCMQAFESASQFAEENQLGEKAKDAAGKLRDTYEAAVEYNRDNEVMLKARAIAEVGLDEIEKAKASLPKSTPKAKTVAKTKSMSKAKKMPMKLRKPISSKAAPNKKKWF